MRKRLLACPCACVLCLPGKPPHSLVLKCYPAHRIHSPLMLGAPPLQNNECQFRFRRMEQSTAHDEYRDRLWEVACKASSSKECINGVNGVKYIYCIFHHYPRNVGGWLGILFIVNRGPCFPYECPPSTKPFTQTPPPPKPHSHSKRRHWIGTIFCEGYLGQTSFLCETNLWVLRFK